ncbi:helix-turn-helix domain-containing protein [Streptomyces sp. DSM 40484]|uniref:helix-turn-helix domain-containing protein n=1 Tax=Streptomyces kroppenstedtii TaxID=3051181 RepID=UPI0028D8DA8D|nr:helix-turn-helix domain-containing protein [Streptomyces sp. DSM 40484]
METENTPPVEDFAQALAALKAEYQVNESEIARAIGVSPATVNTWVHRQRVPRDAAIRKLANRYPKFSVKRLTDAAGRRAPGPLSPEAEERLLELFKGLTEEQQAMAEIQLRAVRDSNR